ncbi:MULTISPECIES: AraC family transcriptional regulator [Acinetobacter]|uniref:AraC family transcriptional regulator n=1 Tax=Acinetobacter TaxID=469 RepID=UPI000367C254|nr:MULTISPECIES: AraC family transcriptional regulator [Acinetobacter]RXT01901.1 AraC family transcriptional regulator [Acinetobacter junii]
MLHPGPVGGIANKNEAANIPVSYTRLIGRELDLQARDLPSLLKFTTLNAEQLMRDDSMITASQQIQILQNSLELATSEQFGLRLGRRLTPSTHGAMGFLINSSPNLMAVLNAFHTFLPTRMSLIRLEVQSDAAGTTCLIFFEQSLSSAVHRLLSETIAVIFLECAEFIIGRPLTEAVVHFSHAAPAHYACYADYLACTYQFDQAQLLIQIPTELCLIANASAHHDSYLLAMQQCEIILNRLNTQQYNTTYQVQKAMLSYPLGQLSEEDLAAALFMNKRTLARRLVKENTSYRLIRDRILSEKASSYLHDPQISVEAIASLLNYHDSANFRRAFKRWFGVSPSAYRRKITHRQEENDLRE